ncbi:MAG: SGNH/GDSL hydrolase family protein [Nitrospira sp.]
MRYRWESLLVNLTLLLGSLAFSLILCEAILRVVAQDDSPLSMDIYRLDPDDSLSLKPNVTRRHFTREWNVAVAINAEGLRDRPSPVPDKRGSILALGDSFAFGWGVELPETYLYIAEEELRLEAIRVIKAGIPGTGTTDQLQWLRQYGETYAPRLVIVSLFVGNDFTDVQNGGFKKQFTIKDGLMVRRSLDGTERGSPVNEGIEKLKRSSRLAQRLAQVLWYLQNTVAPQDRSNPGLNAADRWLWEFAKVHLRQPLPETVEAFARMRTALDDIHQWCRQHNAKMLLLILPRSMQIYDWELAKWKEAYRLDDEALDLDKPQRFLADWATERHVAILDLLPEFRAYQKRHAADRLYFYPDGHMNPIGHRLTGALLAKRLKEFGFQ